MLGLWIIKILSYGSFCETWPMQWKWVACHWAIRWFGVIKIFFITFSHDSPVMMHGKFGFDWLKVHRKKDQMSCMGGFLHWNMSTPKHVQLSSVTITALAFGLSLFPCHSSTLSLIAHYSAFQSTKTVIPFAIRSFIKEFHSDEGNKGDGGDHSKPQSLHGTGTSPLQNGLQGLLSSGQKCFWQEANCVGCKKI